MVAKKYMENWFVWIFVDLVYLPLYYSKHLPLTTILYFLFLILAIRGYKEWNQKTIRHAA
jgi:nicotinamide mononucleotide transporter